MRDPERLTSSNGLSDLERQLLDAGKNETMPAALREQMERALGLTGAAATGGMVRARVEAATGVKASAIFWISAGVVVLAVVGGLVGVRLGSRLFPARAGVPVAAPAAAPEPSASVAAPSVASGGAAPVAAVAAPAPAPAGMGVAPDPGAAASPSPPRARRAVALAAAPVRLHSRAHAAASHAGTARGAGTRRNHAAATASSASSAKPVAPVDNAAAAIDKPSDAPIAAAPLRAATSEQEPAAKKAPPARAAVPAGDLRAEIDLIDGARAALRAGDTAEAMDRLGQHAMHFPHGALAPEETALRVEALMRMGRTAEAKAYARRFVAANPASPLAERVRRLVNGDTAP
jgi:hypothetical protein